MSTAAVAAVAMSRSSSSNRSTTSADSPRMMTSYHPHNHHHRHHQQPFMQQSQPSIPVASAPPQLSRYESQKRRDWITFGQYLKNHRPPLNLSRCSGAHVLEFLRYLDQFGKTKVHVGGGACPFYGHPNPPAPCACPLKQAWGSLDAIIGRLRAAFEEKGGLPEMNPFGARAVRLYLREVRDTQAKARGIAYKKKRKKPTTTVSQAAKAAVQHEEQGQRSHFMSGGYGGGGGGAVFGGAAHQPNEVVFGGASRGSMMPLSVLNR